MNVWCFCLLEEMFNSTASSDLVWTKLQMQTFIGLDQWLSTAIVSGPTITQRWQAATQMYIEFLIFE